MASKQPKGLGLADAFKIAAIVGAGYVIAPNFDPLQDELKGREQELEQQFEGIKTVLGENYVGRCLTGNQAKDFAEGKRNERALSDDQKLLVKMYQGRRETAIGRYINISQKDFNTVTCVQNQPGAGYLGLYADWHNVATVNLGNINEGKAADAKTVMKDERLFNLAMRTAYEEMAHAWQGNTQKSISTAEPVHPLHTLMWTLSVEAQAKLITFMALQEHRERGDAAPWNTAISGRTTDKAQMNALQKVLDANPGVKITELARTKPEALCPVFKAFFTDPMPRSLYEGYIAGFAGRSTSTKAITDAQFVAERGALPGLKSNYLVSCNLSINDPAIVKFFDKNAEAFIRRAMNRNGLDAGQFGLR